MDNHVGIDVSLELSSLCVLDAGGKIVREAKVASEPEAPVAFVRGLGLAITRIGLEAGPLSQWLHDGLREAGFDVVLLGQGTAPTGTSRRRCRPWQSRQIAATLAGSPSGGHGVGCHSALPIWGELIRA